MLHTVWAKKTDTRWLPLTQHLKDTSYILVRLYEEWLSEGQRNLIRHSTELPEGVSEEGFVGWLGMVHDLGKSTPVFQRKTRVGQEFITQKINSNLYKQGFIGFDVQEYPSQSKSPHALAGQVLLCHYGVDETVTSIIGGHHGRAVDSKHDYINQLAHYPENYYQTQGVNSEQRHLWEDLQKQLFDYTLEQSGLTLEDVKGVKVGLKGSVLLGGLLIMADWVASNDDYFPLYTWEEQANNNFNRGQIGWKKWVRDKDFRVNDSSHELGIVERFQQRFGFEPRSIQHQVVDTISKTEEPGVVIFEAPMGIGKTETALILSEYLAQKTGSEGIYIGLPTRATTNAIYDRVEEWMSNKNSQGLVKLHHGKAHLNKHYLEYTKEKGINEYDWFTGDKKVLLEDSVVGTVDSLLQMAYKQNHLALKHLGISKKVVIIDEVHAYDAYMSVFLERTIEWLGVYGVPVVILSATLPGQKRYDIVNAYVRGRGGRIQGADQKNTIKTSNNYPLITYTDGDIVKMQGFDAGDSTKVKIKSLTMGGLDVLVNNVMNDGGILGVVVNTVKESQRLYKKYRNLYPGNKIQLHHSAFTDSIRSNKEEELLREVGKNGVRTPSQVIIGTQVLEQSLDIDFDVMVSEMAPVDLLLQRMGRLHRHSKSRPDGYTEPKYYILGLRDIGSFTKASEFIYTRYLLSKTQHFLTNMEEVTLPRDISGLVQRVYGEGTLGFDDEFTLYKRGVTEQVSKAKKYGIGRYVQRGGQSLVGWLEGVIKGQKRVRDISDSVEVCILKRVGGGLYTLSGQKVGSGSIQLILSQSIKLPVGIAVGLDEKDIEGMQNTARSIGLITPGLAVVILDDKNTCQIGKYGLYYDDEVGITYK